jgi:hypothetical protein
MAIGLISDPVGLFGVAILVFLIVYILVRILTHKH